MRFNGLISSKSSTELSIGLSGLVGLQGPPDMGHHSIAVTIEGRSLCCMRPMDFLVDRVRDRVVRAAEAFARANPGTPLPPVSLTLEAPNLMFALATNACARRTPVQNLQPSIAGAS